MSARARADEAQFNLSGCAWPSRTVWRRAWSSAPSSKRSCREAARAYRCGLHVATDGCAEPQRAAPAIAWGAQRKGAVVVNHCAVRGIERAGGRTAALVTERGLRSRARR